MHARGNVEGWAHASGDSRRLLILVRVIFLCVLNLLLLPWFQALIIQNALCSPAIHTKHITSK